MAEDNGQALSGPDFAAGVKFDGLGESKPFLGHFDGEAVILVRQGEQVFATGAVCTHYSGPLAEGLVGSHLLSQEHPSINLAESEGIEPSRFLTVALFSRQSPDHSGPLSTNQELGRPGEIRTLTPEGTCS
jgi:hypothetical protein